ncbi:DUF5309 domain-containing protein [uncultured Mailhella sp.]|uniref:DUF5309 domain-containing protein n=2 Tax=uncultured Mailhella sp. TaxID=1981031 RepID=UPI0026014485|nr:DUF5309 domain-containing protein [uncultured Mailhella sp.]
MANTVSGQLRDANLKGKPRDLMDMIFNVAPTDTPFLSMCGKSEATQTLHEWQTDTLASPAENAALEGADTTAFSESFTTELSNKTQILRKGINVSGTAQAVKQAGVSRQYAYQMALRTRELKKDVEYALLQNKVARADNGSSEGRLMTGLPCWMQTNYATEDGTRASLPGTACTAGTTRVPTEAMLKALLTDIYNAGGNPDRIMMAPDIRVKMSEVLSGGTTRMEKAERRKATAVIDVYVSDFGALKLVPNRVQAFEPFSKTCAFVLDPQYWKVAYLRGFTEERLAVTGDSLKGHVLVECTLEARNDASSGVLADLKSA